MNINKLHSLLNNSKYTKVALATRCGVSRVTIDNLLSGADVKISTIEAVASALNVSVGYFFDDNEPTNSITGNNDSLTEVIKSQQETINRQSKIIETLTNK